MSSMKISAQDKKELEKFTKFLALKSAQIIVQSRLGEKIKTSCNPKSTGTDWFNLAINDVPEVLAEAKAAVTTSIGSPDPLCIEISLKNEEGDSMVLETWTVGCQPSAPDPPLPNADHHHHPHSVRITYTAYNRMGILLKSLVSVTRVTPAYKISRRQGPDSYTICYRMFVGQPLLTTLGDGFKEVRVGQVGTPVGTVSICVAYRTKLAFSPHQSRETSAAIMVKSDHFRPDSSPPLQPRQSSDDTNASLSDTIKIGAFADSRVGKVADSELVMPDAPFSRLLRASLAASTPAPPPQPQPEPAPPAADSNGNTAPSKPAEDDFLLHDLKTPFAGYNGNKEELGAFFNEFRSAPPLQGDDANTTVADHLGDLTTQLQQFELDLQQYDKLITSLCHRDNNN